MKIDEALSYLDKVQSDKFTVLDFPKEERQKASKMMRRLVSRGYLAIVGKKRIGCDYVNVYKINRCRGKGMAWVFKRGLGAIREPSAQKTR